MFLYSQWLKLSLPTRAAIATPFGIIKRGSTEVFDNRVIRDGYVIEEVEAALNIDAIQKYLGAEDTDMAVLWDKLVSKAEGREYVPPERSKFEAMADGDAVIVLDNSGVLDVVVPKIKPTFCDQCTSKGVRHKKECPKYVPTR